MSQENKIIFGQENMQIFEEERKRAQVKGEDVSLFIFRTREILEDYLKVSKIIAEDPILRFSPKEYSMSKSELLEVYYKRMARSSQLFDFYSPNTVLHYMFQYTESFPIGIHYLMFVPQIRTVGTDEQIARWSNQVETLEIIGCYAQTELGHGSDVQSLETTATYDRHTQEFIINTPSIRAAKFWPGDLGYNSNYALVVAQLIIDGVHYGVQSFIVQTRDIKTHKVLDGVELGDIGPKLSYLSKDNGYAIFRNVRIPRMNMLMRYTQVSPEGVVTRSGNEKVAYATMMYVRAVLTRLASFALASTLTIAVRYSIYRTQFKNDSKQEIKLLDYQLQMNKLIPNIAISYAIRFGSIQIQELIDRNNKNIKENGDFSLMNVSHSLLSGTKAFYSWTIHQNMEIIRQACGGQGFSMYSGIPMILLYNYPNVTLEGENTVMALQCSRYIMKSINYILKGKPIHSSLSYLSLFKQLQDRSNIPKIQLQNVEDILNIETMQQLLRILGAQNAVKTYNTITYSVKQGRTHKEAMNKDAGINLVDLAESYINIFSFTSFIEAIALETNTSLIKAMQELALLYGVGILLSKGVLLYELGIFGNGTQLLLENARNLLFDRIRPNALVLVEAWQFSDNILKSAIGNSNGSYELLYDWAKNHTPFNQLDQKPGFHVIQEIRGQKFNGTRIIPKL